MACQFVVYLPQHEETSAIDVVVAALDTLESIESRLTVYQPTSEISRINQFAGQAVRVSLSTAELIRRGLDWSQRTAGAFDITAGPLIDAWGFSDRKGRKPSPEEIEAARNLVGFDKVDVEMNPPSVKLAQPGMKINLGAIGKGHAMDQVAAYLSNNGVEHFLMHAGASSVIARGHEQPPPDRAHPNGATHQNGDDQNPFGATHQSTGGDNLVGATHQNAGQNAGDDEVSQMPDPGTQRDGERAEHSGWRIGIAHPTVPKRTLGHVWLFNQALSTSGSGKQYFHYRGKRYGHVLDPRTGQPAGDALSISVVTDHATNADAAATAMFVMNQQQRQELKIPMVIASPGQRQDEVTTWASEGLHWQPSGDRA